MRVGLAISLLFHSAILVAVLLCFLLHRPSSLEAIPISVATDAAQTLVVAQVSETSGNEGQSSAPQIQPHLPADNPPPVSDRGAKLEPKVIPADASAQPPAAPETSLWAAGQASPAIDNSIKGFVDGPNLQEPQGVKITRHADWEASPVEDDKLTYSAPDSSLKFTVREAHAAGFGASAFTPSLGMQAEESSGGFSLASAAWDGATIARSQKVDWTIVDLENFGITAFGYQNEVGSDFKPFGQTKSEFGSAGTSTMKAGGQVRIGAFGFGFAQSSRQPVAQYGFAEAGANLAAIGQEASVTLNLAQLLPGTQATGHFTKLIPTLWASASNEHTPSQEAVPSDTVSTSFGGSWTWDTGNLNLGYWSYSSSQVAGSAWSGQGVDASFGVYYSSFGFDADFSYGSSGDVAPSWQSAGALYGSDVTVSYTPEKLPGIWASASAGNYDQSAITFGDTSSAFSDMYKMSSNGQYWSLTAGIDLTNLFWTPDGSDSGKGQLSSIKLLYRYSDGLYSDNSTGSTRDAGGLAAVMIRRTF
jgi:hypothetical protein